MNNMLGIKGSTQPPRTAATFGKTGQQPIQSVAFNAP
jgi:hypothetical protein